MYMKSYIVFATLLLVAIITPTTTHGYSVTNSTATDLGNGHALFTVTYKFGFLNREMYMPIKATRNTKFTDKGEDVRYSVLFNGETKAVATTSKINDNNQSYGLNYSLLPGKAKGIVVSSAEIKNNRYYLPEGRSATFTLVAIVDMNNSQIKENISLQITSLPFILKDGQELKTARLNSSELASYKTEEVTLK